MIRRRAAELRLRAAGAYFSSLLTEQHMIHLDIDNKRVVFSPPNSMEDERAQEYRQRIESALDEGFCEFWFDFRDTTRIASTALGVLTVCWRDATRRGAVLRAVNANDHIRLLFEETKLNQLFAGDEDSDIDPLSVVCRLNEAMSVELRVMERLQRGVFKLLRQDKYEEMALTILRIFRDMVVGDQALYFEVEDGDPPRLRLIEQLDTPFEHPDGTRYAIESGSAEEASLSGGRARWAHSDSPLLKQLEIEHALMAPMLAENGRSGLFVVQARPSDGELPDSVPAIMEAFAGVAALASEKACLVSTLEERSRRLEAALNDLTRAQGALNDSSKLATLGALVSGLSHAFNNRLVPILGYSQLWTKRFEGDEKLSRQMEILEASAKDLKRMLDRLTNITRGKPPTFDPDNINRAIESALRMVEPLLTDRGIRVETEFDPDAPDIELDYELIIQGFLSILYRAQFIYGHKQEDRLLRVVTAANDDGGVDVTIEDNGRTLDEEALKSILDPLEPLQRIGIDEVFNLSVPASVMKKHRGTLDVEAREDSGTRIRISLPAQSYSADHPVH